MLASAYGLLPAAVGAVAWFLSVTASNAQNIWVMDTTFCKKITNKECEPEHVIGDGQSVDVADLETNAKGSIVYFYGGMRNKSRRIVFVSFTRQGECYQEGLTVAGKSTPQPSWVTRQIKTVTTFLLSLSPADLVGRMGAKEASMATPKGSGVDVRLNIVGIEQSDYFRAAVPRNVFCVGPLQARWMDSTSVPLEPEASNPLKTINITDRHKRAAAN